MKPNRISLIKSSGGTGPMKLRQPLADAKKVPIPIGTAYEMGAREYSLFVGRESFLMDDVCCESVFSEDVSRTIS